MTRGARSFRGVSVLSRRSAAAAAPRRAAPPPERLPARLRVRAVGFEDPDLARGERRIRLDAVDERRAARAGGERLLERDDLRALPRDRVERLQRVGVRERLRRR